MKITKPQVHLIHKKVNDKIVLYTLHAVTFFNNTRYSADGYDISPTPNAEGRYTIKLKVNGKGNIRKRLLTPVVHTLTFPPTLFAHNDYVEIVVADGLRLGGGTSVSGISSEEDPKPIPEED